MTGPLLVGRRVGVAGASAKGQILAVAFGGGTWRLLVDVDGAGPMNWNLTPGVELSDPDTGPPWLDEMHDLIGAAHAAVVTGDPVEAERLLEQALDLRDANRAPA